MARKRVALAFGVSRNMLKRGQIYSFQARARASGLHELIAKMAARIKPAPLISITLMLLAVALPTWAQVQLGEDLSMSMGGNVQFGYSGDYSNVSPSDHGTDFGGNANLNGYYYNPNFLSFNVQPYYNQSRANSDFQSLFQASGVSAGTSIFGGSNFPGAVSYNFNHNAQGSYSYALPGLENIVTSGDNRNLSAIWGVHIPDYPSVTAHIADGSSNNSIFGTDEESTSHSDAFGVGVSHRLVGFNLNGGYQHTTVNSQFPGVLLGGTTETLDSTNSTYNVEVGHALPMKGGFSAGFSRSDLSSDYNGGSYNGTIDTINSGVGFNPRHNLNLGVNAQYTDNLAGTIYQPITSAGGALPPQLLENTTNSLGVTGQASYDWSMILHFTASASRITQTVLGKSLSSNVFQQLVNYGNTVKGGFLNVTGGLSETTVNVSTSTSSLGFFENASYNRMVRGWELSGGGNYSRNTETVLITYTTSGYGYAGQIGRRIGLHSHWSLSTSGAKSVFNNIPGSGTFSQSYSTALALRQFSVSGSYQKGSGTSFVTPTGLVASPIPLPPSEAILFNGKSYSFGAATTAVSGLILSASWSKAISDTAGSAATSQNSTAAMWTMLQYRLRKVTIIGGYSRLTQGFSVTGQLPMTGSSFYVGISRWFNFF